MIPRTFVIACLVAFAYAKPIARNLVVHESRTTIPQGFVNSGPASESTVLKLRAALVQGNIAGLEQELYAVSTPDSERYGKHLTKEEVEEYIKPDAESTSLVNQWFSENGISAATLTPTGDWLEFSIPVSKANELLGADFSVFTHAETGQQSILTMSYSIPANLKGHLDLIHPTITFSSPYAGLPVATAAKSTRKRASDAAPASCDTAVTPTCLQELYGIPSTKATESSNVLGVAGYQEEWANQADLTTFLADLRPDLSGATFSLVSVDGGINPQTPVLAGTEANLDTQYTVGVASGVPVAFYSVGNTNNGGNFADAVLDLANFLVSATSPPSVITNSYGEDEDLVSAALSNQVCTSWMQLGARGTSVIFASGDGGVAGGHGVSCTTFVPVFPATCPFLTSVGATQDVTETAADFSSGGFSDIFTSPSYQSSAVSTYISQLGSTYAGLYNTTGRGFPDVSAQGVDFEIVYRGSTGTVSGTSCAAPTFASVVALLNDELIAAGKSTLGFLNPLFYASSSAFNDITSGDNPGCGTNGFSATAGWDPITGLGTPNFAALRTAVGL